MERDRTNHGSPESTASDEVDAETEAGEPRVVGRSGSNDSPPEREEEFSLVDPLLWAPLILVGVGLVVFPEPATTLVGLVCIAAGVFLASVDVLSPSGSLP